MQIMSIDEAIRLGQLLNQVADEAETEAQIQRKERKHESNRKGMAVSGSAPLGNGTFHQ